MLLPRRLYTIKALTGLGPARAIAGSLPQRNLDRDQCETEFLRSCRRCAPSSGLDVMPTDPVERQAIMPVSVLLHRLSDDTAPDHFTLKWLMSSMHQQSFGIMLLLMALVGAAPVISLVGGFLLLVLAVQMILGCAEPTFPTWIANWSIKKSHLRPVLVRAIPLLEWLEKIVHPRFEAPANLTKRLVGAVILLLTIRLLVTPIPMSNIPPSIIIALISLAYLEQDGLLLLSAVLAACVLLGIDLSILWQLGRGAVWIKSLFNAAP